MLNISHRDDLSLDWIVILAIFMFPITFLTVRHGVHISLFVLLLIAVCNLNSRKSNIISSTSLQDWLIVLSFSGLFLSVFLSQALRGQILLAAFDGPSRILFSGIIFIYLKRLNIDYVCILERAIPIGLICTLILLKLNPDVYWIGRYATYFVDPNTLGSQSLILAGLSLIMLGIDGKKGKLLILLQVSGTLIGLYISVGSGSRGGWLVAPFIFLLMIFIKIDDLSSEARSEKLKFWRQFASSSLLLILLVIVGFYYSDKAYPRFISTYFELRDWFSGANPDGSAGIRLNIWKFSFEFISQNWLIGYGEEKNMMQLLQGSHLNVPINQVTISTMSAAGPHSDLLSKLLGSGIFGVIAYCMLLLAPFIIFWRHRSACDIRKMQAARIGLYYTFGVFVAGLTNEQLSLKYLCTFYGLMTATLLAQVLYKPSTRVPAR